MWHKVGRTMLMTRKSECAKIVLSQSGTGETPLLRRRRFALPFLRKEVVKMVKKLDRKRHLQTAYWSLVAAVSAMVVSVSPVFADTIWDRFSAIMRDIYGQIVGISTIVAVTVAAIALVVRMVSRNQRAVDEATAWLKRIVITWLILNMLGFIVAYLQPLIAGGTYTG